MTNLKQASLCVLIASITLAAAVTLAEAPLSLGEIIREAQQRPAASASRDQARALEAVAHAERRRALFPAVQLDASASRRSRELTLTTGAGVLPVADKQRFAASFGVRQPLLDAARLFYTAPAAKLEARAASLSAERTSEELAAVAADRYFAVLELDARVAALRGQQASLENRLTELETLVSEGRAIDRDRRRLRLALDDVRLGAENLGRQRQVATLALGHAIGRDQPVEPAPLVRPARASKSVDSHSRTRTDVSALLVQRDALTKRRQAVRAELIPTVALEGAWIFDDSLFADQEQFFTVTVNLKWTPIQAGTRGMRRRALEAQQRALSRQTVELRRQAALERRSAEIATESARASQVVAKRGLADALETQRVGVERYRAGRETIGDLLEVEALVADRKTRLELSVIAIARARIASRLANGSLLTSGR